MAEAFAASKGGHGYRRVKAMLRTGVSEKVIRGIWIGNGVLDRFLEDECISSSRCFVFSHVFFRV